MQSLLSIVIVLTILAMLMLMRMQRSDPSAKRALWVLLPICLGLIWLRTTTNRETPPAVYDVGFEEALSYHLGLQIAKDMPEGGTLLVLQYPKAILIREKAEAERNGLRKALSQDRFDLIFTSPFDDPMEVSEGGISPESGYDLAQLNALIAEHPDTDAIVFLIQFPSKPANWGRAISLPFYAGLVADSMEPGGPDYPRFKAYVTWRDDANLAAKVANGSSADVYFNLRYRMEVAE